MLFTAAITALVLVAEHAAPVAADHGGRPIDTSMDCDRHPGPDRCVSVGDDRRHFVYFDASLTEGLAASLRDTMIEDYEPTTLEMIVQTAITPETDVVAYSLDYGDNGAAGWTNCPAESPQGRNTAGHRWCLQQTLHFNLNPRFAEFFGDDASRDHLACHELGHTLGLRHWGNPPQSDGPVAATCMNANTPNGPTDLHSIDWDHINAYPYSDPTRIQPAPAPRLVGKRLARGCGGMPGEADDDEMGCRERRRGGSPADRDTSRLVSIWAIGRVEALEVERHASLPELAGSAEAVVRGRVVRVEPGRVFGDPHGDALHYASAIIRVDEVLAGGPPAAHAAELTVEIPLFQGPETIGLLQAAAPGPESIFFLRNKGASALAAGMPDELQQAEAAYYRLVVFGAVIENRGGVAVSPAADDFPAALDGVRFADVVREVRDAAS